MNNDRLNTTCNGVELAPMNTLQRIEYHDGPQEQSQHSLNAEPPLSPWSLRAEPDEMLSNSKERFESSGLRGIFDDGPEPSMSIRNSGYYENISGLETREHDTGHEEDLFDVYTNTRSDDSATIFRDMHSFGGDLRPETSLAVPGSRDLRVEISQAMKEPIEPSRSTSMQSRPGKSLSLNVPMNEIGFQPPSILVSNHAIEDVQIEDLSELPESYNSGTLPAGEIQMEQDIQILHKPLASDQRSVGQQDLKKDSPNNYDIATHDRQPRSIPGGIDPRSEKIAADKLAAFCVDADLTVAEAADAAALHHTDANLLHVERDRLSGRHPLFHTRMEKDSSLQHRQYPSRTPPISSMVQSSSQFLTYLTPPLSFTNLAEYQRLDSASIRGSASSTQSSPSRNGSMEPPSPVSPSPSNSFETADGITRCPDCPNTVFAGRRANQKNSLQRHRRDNHDNKPRLGCLVQGCAVDFAPGRKDNQVKHVRATHPEYPLPAPSKKRKRGSDSESKF